MVATRLGKRSRQVLDEEEISLPPSPRKRRTRLTKPRIYEDETESLIHLKVQSLRAKESNCLENQDTKKLHCVTNCIVHEGKEKPSSLVDSNEHLPTDENNVPFISSTPNSIRSKDIINASFLSTPKHRVRLAGNILTPRSNQLGSTPRSSSIYANARQLFSQSSNPTKLVGRDAEREYLENFISSAIVSQKGGCLYISGPPGTGKSALVHEIFARYESESSVKVVDINCVALRSANDVLPKLYEKSAHHISESRKPVKQQLANLFRKTPNSENQTTLLLLDEMDSLLNGDCESLYNIFEWALHPTSSLILIGVANALDLTDRFLPRLKVRNLKPNLLPFRPYDAAQISGIISNKLQSLLPVDTTATSDFIPLMHPTAIQLAGKKIASHSGDLRKAFNLVRRVVDHVEQESKHKAMDLCETTPTKQPLVELSNFTSKLPQIPTKVLSYTLETAPRATVAHVARISAGLFNHGAHSRLHTLNLQQKAILCSLVATENNRPERDPYKTPSKSTSRIPTIAALFEKYTKLCKKDEGILQTLKYTEFRDVVTSLETLGLIHETNGRMTGLLTPSRTPSRAAGSLDDKQVISAVSEKEMRESLNGPGGELLKRLFDE